LIAGCIAPHTRAAITVALHTGMRLGEILNQRWQDLDFGSNFILVHDSKNGDSRHVPMDATLSTLFRSWPRLHGQDIVFASVRTGGRIVDIRAGFLNACKRGSPIYISTICGNTFARQFVMS